MIVGMGLMGGMGVVGEMGGMGLMGGMGVVGEMGGMGLMMRWADYFCALFSVHLSIIYFYLGPHSYFSCPSFTFLWPFIYVPFAPCQNFSTSSGRSSSITRLSMMKFCRSGVFLPI